MDNYNLSEIGILIGVVSTSIIGIFLALQKSKCEEINCCCLRCKRNVQAIIDEERLKLTGHTGQTPRKEEDIVKLELKEPEPED